MNTRTSIRDLLQQLPLERLDASAREIVERARSQNDPAVLRAAVRQATGELLRRGELLRVAVEGGQRRETLFLVRGTSRLVDLAGLTPGRAAVAERPADAMVPDRVEPTAASLPYEETIPDLLEAMERAQELAVGDPRADEPAIMVDRILALLQSYLPGLALQAQLSTDQLSRGATEFLLPAPALADMPFWLRHRRPGQSLWFPDPAELPAGVQRHLGHLATQAAVTAVVPLRSPAEGDQEIGLLFVSGPADWPAEPLLRLAHRLSAFVSRRWQCQRDVNRRVLTDSLTQIRNRAFFDTQFPLELERAHRGGAPMTLVIGDLDEFKVVNDTYGHQCGDLVLQAVARQLQTMLRRIDYVCRVGGEEFALILPYTSRDEAREVLARMAGRPFRVALPPEIGVGVLAVTMSYGTVTFPDAGTSPGELHRKADSMLYRAKELGRNRCCIWVGDGHCQQLPPADSRDAPS
ncbi:MAG TPA: GGDEF domain-containing protein [Candidatus Krumholzibacteria bacterium]|nr:GGDEF domain-containing protein [Candidatus Krumholzibacteria bacterium]HPD71599.1 GGDEF domain-containing protein [Candidatus Krumholzibacteria bacterium]HRY41468.1 GGDEF domain-containing protein [Candidatus Krumholzibacteria bacterium]